MSIPSSLTPLFNSGSSAAAPDPSYTGLQISRSLRFNSADSAYLSRTPAVAGNMRTWTWAAWVKRSGLGLNQLLFGSSTLWTELFFNTSNQLQFYAEGGSIPSGGIYLYSNAVFRDISAWMHIVWVLDTTQSTAANMVKVYVNGTQITLTSSANLSASQNLDFGVNTTNVHGIGSRVAENNLYLSAYLANIHFIDGQALTPSSFTETDATYANQLVPKTYSGSYGTNGFNLLFADNSAATSSTLGNDSSSNNNDWTPNNLSVTAGTGNDSLVDSPTNYGTDTGVGGEVRGNYCVGNWLNQSDLDILKDGNLQWRVDNTRVVTGTIAMSSGKWYWEATINAIVSYIEVGIVGTGIVFSAANNTSPGVYSSGYVYRSNANKVNNNSSSSYGASFSAADTIGIAFDSVAGTLTFYKNGASQGTAFTGIPAGSYVPTVFGAAPGGHTGAYFNFGQRAFAYQSVGSNRPASDFKCLCTQNLLPGTITTSGSFTGNASAEGPFVYLNGVPTAMTINSNAVTFATHADKLSNGFKVRSSSASYNTSGSNTYSITTTGDKFKYARAQPNP